MLLAHAFLFFVILSGLIHAYDIDTDLARGLVYNDSVLIGVKSNDGRHFSDYPEDCTAIYLNAKTLNQHVQTGIYEIWPREGIFFR
jgi:hypothetical protein